MKKAIITVLSLLTLSACQVQNTSQITPGPDDSLVLGKTSTESESPNDTSDLPLPDDTIESMPPQSTTPQLDQNQPLPSQAVIKTSKGDITLKLYPQTAPKTITNFLSKANSNFYNNLIFHRVEDWVIQGGDPLGNGTGGGKIETELSDVPFKKGSLGVARGGDIKVSNDSQFFICTKDCSWLTGQYTNFGEVVTGLDVALQIKPGDKILSITVQ